MRYAIIGNGPAAIGAIEGIRQIDQQGTIALVSKEPYAAYSRPLITYYMADLPENIAYEITKAIMDHPQEVAAVHQSGKAFTIQNSMTGDAPIPFHPGAVRYYKEVGAWREGLPIAK